MIRAFVPSLAYSVDHPMTPLGGLFFITMGVFVLLGAALPRYRLMLVWIGFAAAGLGLALGWRLAIGLPPPSFLQFGALVIAIALEVAAFRVLMPRLRIEGLRRMLVGALGIVGVHFIVMLPTFGALVAGMGVLCSANAAIAWRVRRYPLGLVWTIDGLVKLGFGAAMLSTSPLFH